MGVDTGNTRSPYYFTGVELEDGSHRLYECCHPKRSLPAYDQSVKQAGAQNKVGPLARLAFGAGSFFSLDYSIGQCIEVSQNGVKR